MYLDLSIVAILAFIFWAVFLFKIRKAQFMWPNKPGLWADNEMMTYAASKAHKWHWPSDMHKEGIRYTQMKDITILSLAFWQRVLRIFDSPLPLITSYSFTIPTSTVLIYLIGASYWTPAVAMFVAMMFLFSLWAWQMSLFGGHLNIATLFLLASIFCLTRTVALPAFNYWSILAGILFGCTLFASASSHRYILLFFSAAFYSEFGSLISKNFWELMRTLIKYNFNYILYVFIPVLIILGLALAKIFYKRFVSAMYNQTLPKFLNRISQAGREKHPLETYLQRTKKTLFLYTKWVPIVYIFLLILLTFIGWTYLLPIFIGIAITFLILTLPNIPKNFAFYMEYVMGAYVVMDTSFNVPRVVDFFNKQGLNVSRRGAGFKWTRRLYIRFVPIHTFFFIATELTLAITTALSGSPTWTQLILVTLVALSPIIYGEATSGVQLSRPYASGVIGFLVLLGFGGWELQTLKPELFWPLIGPILAITLAWNLWKFITDIYPARMTITNLVNTLDKLGIKEFSTHKTDHNVHLVYAFKDSDMARFKINYIQNLDQVKNGWVVVPPTSGKSSGAPSSEEFFDGDFTKDKTLNDLIETRRIEKIASAKFKTWGTSNIWTHEGEYASCMDLGLKATTEKDRYRGYAWLLHWPESSDI